jgi:hypothetical protein
VFASVGEYEAALDSGDEEAGLSAPASAAIVSGVAAAAAARARPAETQASDATTPAASVRAATAPNARQRPRANDPAADPDQQAELDEIMSRSRQTPVAGTRGRGRRVGAIVAILLLVVALLAGGTAAAFILPSAEITVTPRIEAVGPIEITVTADPAATAVDPVARVIPAQTVEIPVEASGEFKATGKRVEETKAKGGVRWRNCDPTASYSIPKGTVVKTAKGTGFATEEVVFLPVAIITASFQLQCQTSEVGVTAVDAGEAGNVAAGAITVVPARYNRTVITVSNAAPTAGGTRTEFPKVDQKDVGTAVELLRKDLETQFATALRDPAVAPRGVTMFPDTATLGDSTAEVDPATLVGQEVESFTVKIAATGRVLAVDASPVEAIAAAQLTSSVKAGNELVEGSISVKVGQGTATEGLIDFPVTGTARQLRPLDAAALERQVLGLSKTDATTALSAYGAVAITLWPGWVTTIPSLDQRVTVVLAEPVDTTPEPTPRPTPRPTAAPTPNPKPVGSADASGGEPVPSG